MNTNEEIAREAANEICLKAFEEQDDGTSFYNSVIGTQIILSAITRATEVQRETRIYTRCPACGNDTLTINKGHLLCTWFECPDPTKIDRAAPASAEQQDTAEQPTRGTLMGEKIRQAHQHSGQAVDKPIESNPALRGTAASCTMAGIHSDEYYKRQAVDKQQEWIYVPRKVNPGRASCGHIERGGKAICDLVEGEHVGKAIVIAHNTELAAERQRLLAEKEKSWVLGNLTDGFRVQLLSTLAAIEKHNKTHPKGCRVESFDLSLLDAFKKDTERLDWLDSQIIEDEEDTKIFEEDGGVILQCPKGKGGVGENLRGAIDEAMK